MNENELNQIEPEKMNLGELIKTIVDVNVKKLTNENSRNMDLWDKLKYEQKADEILSKCYDELNKRERRYKLEIND